MIPGQYIARLILRNGQSLFYEHQHHITIHETGEITESRYYSSITHSFHNFIPERVWDKNFLYEYDLEMI